MEKQRLVLFGAGMMGEKTYDRYENIYEIKAIIDNNPHRYGEKYKKTEIIDLNEYKQKYMGDLIMISTIYFNEVENQLIQNGITDYVISPLIYEDVNVVTDEDIQHGNWPDYLKKLCDKEGADVLEVGSRLVTGDYYRCLFEKANYVGFDIYPGENVDVVGDAHELSSYFDKKFDLIFSSAVFEHLAMPWKVSTEMIKLLKPNGYIFIETHYSYASHERPWHFFQYSENALDVLFPRKFGMECLKKGCCNLLEGRFSYQASDYLRGKIVPGLYCHSEYLGKKVKNISENELKWDNITMSDVVGSTKYPRRN